MTPQCLQQCHQCHHSAYSSAIKNSLFAQVSDVQCHQCHQLPITHLRMRVHAHVGPVLSRCVMALMALLLAELRQQADSVALFGGTEVALVMALPLADQTKTVGGR